MQAPQNQLALPVAFVDKVRERIFETISDFMSEEQLQEMVHSQIKEFFETAQLVIVEQREITVNNPAFGRVGAHENWKEKVQKQVLALNAQMTPFRQMVWHETFVHLQPKIQRMLEDENAEAHLAIQDFLDAAVKPRVKEQSASMMANLATAMAGSMMYSTMARAADMTNETIKQSFTHAGYGGWVPAGVVPPVDWNYSFRRQERPQDPPDHVPV